MKWISLLALCSACLLGASDPEADRLPPGPGKAEIAKVCVDCHDVGNIRRQRLSRDEWTSEVSDMVDRGAQASDDQLDAIIGYLTANFGKDSKVYVNTAPMAELKTVLNLTAAEADAVVAYRDAHGDFHQVDDLLKVPGLDGKKIEAKKDLLQF